MNTAAPVLIDSTAREINEAHRLARQHAESAVQYAIRCGELLTKAKIEVGHGNFKPWVSEHCDFAYSTAARYMKAAAQKSTGVDFSTLSELYHDTDEKPAPAAQQPTFEDMLSVDLSTVGPPMTDEEREYVAKSDERIGRMIADFADRQAQAEAVAAELRERFPTDERAYQVWHKVEQGLIGLLEKSRQANRLNQSPPEWLRESIAELWIAISRDLNGYILAGDWHDNAGPMMTISMLKLDDLALAARALASSLNLGQLVRLHELIGERAENLRQYLASRETAA